MGINYKYLLFTLFCFLSIGVESALSQPLETTIPKSSTSYEVGFTFHKLAGTEPNYKKWVDVYLGEKLSTYGEEGKKEQFRRAHSSFRNQFLNYNLNTHDTIIINLPAMIEIVSFENRYLMNIDVGSDADFIIKETPEMKINLVVPELEDKLKHIIPEHEYKHIIKASNLNFEKPQSIRLILKLKPVSVDAKKPAQIGKDEYWLMLMKFESYEIWHPYNDTKYWSFTSEEDRKKELMDLRSLYKSPNDDN